MHILNRVEEGLVLVFTETKRMADTLEYKLSCEGFPDAYPRRQIAARGEDPSPLQVWKNSHPRRD